MSHLTLHFIRAVGGAFAALRVVIVFTCQAKLFRCAPRTPQGNVPLAVELRGVTAPRSTCSAAFKVRPSWAVVRRASSALIRLRIWLQPRSLRMRLVASLSERCYQQAASQEVV